MRGHSEWALVLPFDSDDPTFVRGVEVGRLYEMALRCPEQFDQLIHASNAEMALRIGEAVGRHVSASDVAEADEWLSLQVAATRWAESASSSPRDCSDRTAGMSHRDSARSAVPDSRAHRSQSVGKPGRFLPWIRPLSLVALWRRLYSSVCRERNR